MDKNEQIDDLKTHINNLKERFFRLPLGMLDQPLTHHDLLLFFSLFEQVIEIIETEDGPNDC